MIDTLALIAVTLGLLAVILYAAALVIEAATALRRAIRRHRIERRSVVH